VVQILSGNGNGTFVPQPNTYAIGTIWQSTGTMITADLDSDGTPDLAIVGQYDVTVLVNNGTGGFQSTTLFSIVDNSRHQALAVADFNGDGKLDLAVSKEPWSATSATVEMAYGNGNGTFQTPIEYMLPVGVYGFATADLDGDGLADLVSQSPITIMLGKSLGTGMMLDGGGGILGNGGVVIADMNHDGHLDVVSSSADLGIMRGQGDGTFDPPLTIAPWSVGNAQLAYDIDGNGSPDIVAGDYSDLSIVLGHASGLFDAPLHYATGGTYNYQHVIAADIDGNGLADLVTPSGILLHRACVH
jgi:hypothetical protein